MAFVHSKNSKFFVTDSGAVERDLSAFIDSISGLPGTPGLSEVTAFGDQGVKNIPGIQNVSFTIKGHYDPTAATGPHACLNSLRSAAAVSTFKYGPSGNTATFVRMTGSCWLNSYEVESSVGDKVSFSAEFQVDGVVTVDTF